MLRRLFVIAFALGLMLALRAVFGAPAVGDRTVLAAIGFVVLAAFTIGDLGKLIGLPRITGYILGGVALGPQVSEVLTASIVDDMTVFNTLALGLIALTAGLELEVAAIRKVGKTLAVTVAAKIPLLLVFVGGGLFVAYKFFHAIDLPSDTHAMVLCAVIAVFGIGTSPAIAIAVVSETGAKGRLSDLTLGIAIVKDVVVVVCLAIAIAVGGASLEADAPAVGPVLAHLGIELGASMGVGAAIGVLLILYVKYVGRELLLASVAVVLVVAELSAYLHLELLLVFIAAGFVVRNFSHAEHELLPALIRVSLPVFVVFFATAGAQIDLEATLSVLPLAIGLALARALAYYLGTRAGTIVGSEESAIRGNAWYGFLPQAGVTLGLVLLAAKGLPSLEDPIRRLGLALVTIHLLIGPVLLGIALRRAGEISGDPASGHGHADADIDERDGQSAAGANASADGDSDAADDDDIADRPPIEWPRESELADLARDMQREIDDWRRALLDNVLTPGIERSRKRVFGLIADHKQAGGVLEAVRASLDAAPPDPVEDMEAQLADALSVLRVKIDGVIEVENVEMAPALLVGHPEDSAGVGLRKSMLRFQRVFNRRMRRQVPVRMCARAAIDACVSRAVAGLAITWLRVVGDMLRDVGQAVVGERDGEDTRRNMNQRVKAFVATAERSLLRASDDMVRAYVDFLKRIGSPMLSIRGLGLAESQVVVDECAAILATRDRRRVHIDAWFSTLHADVIHAQCSTRIDEVIGQHVRKPVGIVDEHLVARVRHVSERMPQGDIDPTTLDDDGLAKLLADIDAALDKRSHARLRGLQMKYYRATQGSAVLSGVAEVLEGVPDEITLLDRNVVDAGVSLSTEPTLVKLEVARRLHEELFETFAPDLEDIMRPLGDLVAALDVRVQQAVTVASYGVGVARSSEEAQSARASAALDALERSHRLFGQLEQQLKETTKAAEEGATTLLEHTRVRLDIALGRAPENRDPRAGRGRRSWWRRRAARIRLWLQNKFERGIALARALRRRPEVREWMIRSGHERLDAAGIRDYLARYAPETHTTDLPPIYAKLFSGEADDDARLATAHRDILEQLVSALTPGAQEDFTSVLVVGERGSGRTTMINLVTHRCARRKVVRIDARYHGRTGGVVAALAEELDCLHDPESIAASLRRATTIVLVDDLERFLLPGPPGMADLEQFLRLVRQSSRYAHWVVTAQAPMVQLFDKMVSLTGTFGRWIDLKPLDGRELEHIIENRIRISGLDVVCAERASRARWRRVNERHRYYKTLARQCAGNLRWAILTHARCTSHHNDGLRAIEPRPAGMPFLERLGAGPLAVLSTVVAYGELTEDEIANGMMLEIAEVEAYVTVLSNAGLLVPAPGGAGMTIPAGLVDAVAYTLLELRIRGGVTR